MNFAVFVKGQKYRKQANVIRIDGHVVIGSEKIAFDAVLYSFDPQLDKNVAVQLNADSIERLDGLGFDKLAIENVVHGIQQRLLRDEVVYEIE
jgi:hypothetical protein